ncbi:TetR family transcriptional regulator [Rhodococcus sp. IEGM 1379]|uniref:TetR family transcriptional regulator n=1 Tax=Rhodococcus sp. IEGM 1379 TaxID=3047086 RepID=UPI0024B869D4|nr:TetR family transcriptional regulator [Rhodococcus sp. IEGM 1379]MDI9917225.1 TetR family transcriptional regulator [Rhodococcus sp. IEGM 1379]
MAETENTVLIGASIRQARRDGGLSLRELARRLEVSPATLSAVETGKTRVSVDRLASIGGVLGVRFDALLPAAVVRPAEQQTWGRERSDPIQHFRPEEWRRFGPSSFDSVLAAALAEMVKTGYHGAAMREIAKRAQMSVPGLYHHYASKQQMLTEILDRTMAELNTRSLAAIDEGESPAERLAFLVECVTLFHIYRRDQGFIGASEMRSLTVENRVRIAESRNYQQWLMTKQVDDGVAGGVFETDRPRQAARAIVVMCVSVAQWYRPSGRQTPEEIAQDYSRFALDLVRCRRI